MFLSKKTVPRFLLDEKIGIDVTSMVGFLNLPTRPGVHFIKGFAQA